MKKIAIDCSRLNDSDKSGTHRFLVGFINELVTRQDIELTYYFNYLDRKNNNFSFLDKGKVIELERSFYTQLGLLGELKKYDYFIFPWQTVPVFSFLVGGCVVAIIHDYGYTFKTRLFTFLTQIFSKKVFSVSESTSKSLLVNSKIITEGVDSTIFFKIKDTELDKLKKKYNIPDKFILSVGRVEERKNVFNNIKAFSIITKFYPSLKYCFIGKLVIDEEKIYSYIDSLGIGRDKIVFKKYVDDDVLNLYLNSCEFLVFTSKDEGFGLPVIEAYQVGKWVLLSKIQQLAEFNVTANQLVPYDDPQEIANAMVYFMTNKIKIKKEFNPDQVLKKNSWKSSVDMFLEGLEK